MTPRALIHRALILDFGGVVTRTQFETHDLTETAIQFDVTNPAAIFADALALLAVQPEVPSHA